MSTDYERKRSQRDLRLDFFRGIGMFIILIAHIPGNPWINWIPARFGFSDATEIFVFCSGMASAYAFARVFDRHGLAMGTARIALRVWQIWWAQIGVFVAVLALMVGADHLFATDAYTRLLQFDRFFADPATGILGLVTLTYVPNYFDILPMYLVILAMMPVMMAIARIGGGRAVIAVSVLIWLLAQFRLTAMSADPWSGRQWFFDPAGWQLVFFTGFAFIRGWLPTPPRNGILAIVAVAVVLVAIPFCWLPLVFAVPELHAAFDLIHPLTDKTRFGLFRYGHFLALAYLGWLAVGPAGERLKGQFIERVVAVGRQTLAVFLTGLVAAQILGIFLDRLGVHALTVVLVNLAGMTILMITAVVVDWYKRTPWTKPVVPAQVPSRQRPVPDLGRIREPAPDCSLPAA